MRGVVVMLNRGTGLISPVPRDGTGFSFDSSSMFYAGTFGLLTLGASVRFTPSAHRAEDVVVTGGMGDAELSPQHNHH